MAQVRGMACRAGFGKVAASMVVGRRLVIGALCSAIDAAVGGAGGVVLLAGEAGMGKTALASEETVP